MTYQAKILKDSINHLGTRLVTFEVTFPRIVLAEKNTHKMLSKNSASSRALPVTKMLEMVKTNPYIPEKWGQNQSGMQAYKDVLPEKAVEAEKEWLLARDFAVQQAEKLLKIGIHKQTTNRLLEPFMWHTVICSGTEFSNFFNLRNNPEAHPAIQRPAQLMQELYEINEPEFVECGKWHAPLINIGMKDEEKEIIREFGQEGLMKVSVGRCARVSYLTHDGKRDYHKDIELYDRLISSGHLSPTEHVATPFDPKNENHINLALLSLRDKSYWFGNFKNWVQHRKMIPGEFDMLGFKND